MVKQDRGQIINITGSGGTSASPDISAYPASKAAVVRLTDHHVDILLKGTGGPF